MKTPMETFEMKTNFAGLIQLLAKNLYSQVYVFVRELLQNAGDSITLRRELEPDHEGRIDIFTYPRQRTIIFRDNGLGMNEEDIKRFLSVIGSTGTGTARSRLANSDHATARRLVGQFGIGMLSAFVVAGKVIVRTRKLGSDIALAWHNDGSTECRLFKDDKAEVGTEVALILEEEHAHLLENKALRLAVRKFCDFLRYPIFINDEGPANVMNAPWHKKCWTNDEEKNRAYSVFLNDRFPDYAIKIIPVDLDGPVRASGALYITEGKIPALTSNGCVDLYVRRFLITSGDSEILPDWAPFVGGIIDCPDLKPTASRDDIQRNDPKLALLRQELANLIVGYLGELAHDEPEEFAKINECHNFHLKGMALFHEDFFDLFARKLLFNTNKGKMSLDEYLSRNSADLELGPVPLYHFSNSQGRQIYYEMANEANIVVIDAKRSFESDLLAKFAKTYPQQAKMSPVDVGVSTAIFRVPAMADAKLVDTIELGLMQVLSRAGFANVDVRVRGFQPASVPSVALATPQLVAQQNLKLLVKQNWALSSLGDLTDEIRKVSDTYSPIRIIVNLNNPVVRKIASHKCGDDDVNAILSALVFDNPACGGELVSEKLRRYAAECKQKILSEAIDFIAEGDLSSSSGEG